LRGRPGLVGAAPSPQFRERNRVLGEHCAAIGRDSREIERAMQTIVRCDDPEEPAATCARIWDVPEEQAGILPPDLDGLDTVELGCGTGYVSAWLARRGARPVGLDNSAAQLATARALQERFGLRFPLLHASAERAPFADAAFDLVISEYGACIWCDPYAWIPEAARLLRPGGRLIFLVNSVQLMLSMPDSDGLPATERLLRPYFGMHRFEWPDDESVEFHLGHGDMIRLLRRCGLDVEDLIEIRPTPGATASHPLATLEWARRWPSEEVWKARKPR
jgi:SAM-dependent methyltransferase